MIDLENAGRGSLSFIFSVVMMLPCLSVTSRRLQNRGLFGWWQLSFLTGVGVFFGFIGEIVASQKNENKWERDPFSFDS